MDNIPELKPANPISKEKLIAIFSLIVIIFLVGLAIFVKKPLSGSGTNVEKSAPAAPVTREAVPLGVVVPDVGSKVPENVAAPENVASFVPDTATKDRTFSISAQNNRFTPSEIILNKGDNLNLNFTAVDKDYDFVMPDFGYRPGAIVIKKGTTKKITFQVTDSGKFKFYCALCGGPASGPIGYIIAK